MSVFPESLGEGPFTQALFRGDSNPSVPGVPLYTKAQVDRNCNPPRLAQVGWQFITHATGVGDGIPCVCAAFNLSGSS